MPSTTGCPMCKGDGEVHSAGAGMGLQVVCQKCRLAGPAMKTVALARFAWNEMGKATRLGLQEIQRRVDQKRENHGTR